MKSNVCFFSKGRSSGGPPNQPQDPHRSPPDLEDGSSEGPGEQHGGRGGRGHLDHVTQLQGSASHMASQAATANIDHTQVQPLITNFSQNNDIVSSVGIQCMQLRLTSKPILAASLISSLMTRTEMVLQTLPAVRHLTKLVANLIAFRPRGSFRLYVITIYCDKFLVR